MHNAAHSVRHVRQGVRHPVRHQTRAIIGLCGMCGNNAPARTSTAANPRPPVSRMCANHAAHAAHDAHPAICAGFASPHAAHHAAHIPHTPHFFFLLKKREGGEVRSAKAGRQGRKTNTPEQRSEEGMSKGFVRCTEANVAEFNAQLRAEAPEAFFLIMVLKKKGLITGLGGACLGPVGSLPEEGAVPVLSVEAERRIADAHWTKRGGK